MIGRMLGHFRVVERLGAGAMGEVFLAHDSKLGREVALKVLPETFARDADRLSRFRREARSLATVNHPSIAAIHGIEEHQGTHFLVLELVPGATLGARLGEGALPMAEALDVARQIAEALEAAHARGIVHRDLKPANVKVTPDGRVKVLDFGLAKALGDPDGESGTTAAAGVTRTGLVVGTPATMSPEQALGRAVDGRADLWALGCVLYESLSGRAPFPGRSVVEVLAAVLERAPDLNLLPPGTPPSARELIARCLEKDPARRPASARDAADALKRALDDLRGVAVIRAPIRLTQATFASGVESSPAWSPDGRDLVYTREVGGVRKIIRQSWRGGESAALTRGDQDEIMPAWSPDGRTIVFVRSRAPDRMLQPGDVYGEYDAPADVWALDLESGRERLLVERAYNPAFSPDGARIAVDAFWAGPWRIWIVDRNGRNPRQATTDTSEAVAHIRPRWSPDGRMIVFQNSERTKLDVRVVRIADGSMCWVTNDHFRDFAPCFTPDGRHVVFSSAYRGGGINLWRVPVSRDGDALGAPEPVTTGAGQDVDPAPSPDGERLAFAILRQNADLWRLPVDPATGLAAGPARRLIGGTREESRGAWSPDGRRVAFNSDRAGDMNIWLHSLADGSERPLTRGPGGDYQPNWAPDGRSLAFFSARGGNVDVWSVDVESGALRQLTRGGSLDANPFHSPDGSRIAFHSDRDGRLDVWVMNADGSGARQSTQVGVSGHFVRWSPDGRILYFKGTHENVVMRVAAEGGDPEPLPWVKGGAHISLSPDASRVMDVIDHKVLWVSPILPGEPSQVFGFPEPEARIDYPVWSPDGKSVLFDRFQPEGGDIWVAEGF